MKTSPSLVKRQKSHFHNLPCGASIILGNNGFIWICPTINEDLAGGFVQNLEAVPQVDRQTISRLRNCINALSQCKIMIYDTSIMYAFDASIRLGFEVYQ